MSAALLEAIQSISERNVQIQETMNKLVSALSNLQERIAVLEKSNTLLYPNTKASVN